MAEKIVVTPQYLESAAAEMRNAQGNFEGSLNRINAAVGGLSDMWRDELHSLTKDKYETELNKRLTKIPETLSVFADIIASSLRVFENVDSELKSRIMGEEFSVAVGLATEGILADSLLATTQPWNPPPEPVKDSDLTKLGELLQETKQPTLPPKEPDLNSSYYDGSYDLKAPYKIKNPIDNEMHINCVYYARARVMDAMDANSWDSLTPQGEGSDIRPNSIAHFNGHDVYIESVDNVSGIITFSDSNIAGSSDGTTREKTLSEFMNYLGMAYQGGTYY